MWLLHTYRDVPSAQNQSLGLWFIGNHTGFNPEVRVGRHRTVEHVERSDLVHLVAQATQDARVGVEGTHCRHHLSELRVVRHT